MKIFNTIKRFSYSQPYSIRGRDGLAHTTSGKTKWGVATIVTVALFFIGCGQNTEFTNAETEMLSSYRESVGQLQDSGEFQKMTEKSKAFYEESKKGHSDRFKVFAASNYGQVLTVMGQPDEGKRLIDEALSLSSTFSDDTLMMGIYNGYGLYETVIGNNAAAAEYYLKSLEYARRCDTGSLISVLSNLSHAMSVAQDTNGMHYAQEAYQLAKEEDNKVDMTYGALRIMEQMNLRENYDEALKWVKIYVENATPSRAVTSHTLMSGAYRRLKDYDQAEQYADMAIAAADTASNMQSVTKANAYMSKATVLSEKGKYEESNLWLDKTMEYCQNAKDMSLRQNAILYYADNYEHLGNYREALKYRNEERKILTENMNVSRINIFKAKEVALDVAQKDKEIEMHKQQVRNRNAMLAGAILLIVLLAMLCTYIYMMYKRQHRLMKVIVKRAETMNENLLEKQKSSDIKNEELFRRLQEEVENKQLFKDKFLTRDSLAEILGTNRTYITEAVKAMTGMTLPQYISRIRINEAERLLHDKTVDVSNFLQLGESLGFISLSAFQKAFKKQTGMTLSAYRKIARQEADS